VSIVYEDATPVGASIAPDAEFAFTEQDGHARGYVALLHSLVLMGAISLIEAPPATPETSPTPETAPPATPETPPPVTPETPPPAGPPGGYWTLGEQHERSGEPLDGDDDLTIGSVLFSLGILRAGAGVLTIVMAGDPELCPLTQPRGCSGLRNYGWVGVAEGGLMFGTGLTYLAIGAARRQRHRRWERGEPVSNQRSNVVDVGPWLIPRAAGGISQAGIFAGAGLRLQLQF
jgi:hypothetical protein